MKIRQRAESFETKMDMTPLIDCVFLLIMFFILTTQITVQAEEVDLPFALEVKPQPPGGEVTLIINVREKREGAVEGERLGEIVYEGEVINDVDVLTEKLKAEVEYDKLVRKREPELLPDGRELSQLEVLVRYDRKVRSEYLRTIFQACTNVGIYKLKFAAIQPSGG